MTSQLTNKQSRKPTDPPLYEVERKNKLFANRSNYNGEEEQLACGRFPHMTVCASDHKCSDVMNSINLLEVYSGIFMGPFQAGFKTGNLIDNGVTHILNVSCKSYA